MPIGLLGTKIGMTQLFNDQGSAIPVTILQVGPCTITQIKTQENDGYKAIQIGYRQVNSKQLTKPQIGHLKKSDIPALKYLREYRCDTETINNLQIGDILNLTNFKIGHFINISGYSIGKGFSGYQKRHHFSRGPMSHGSKNHRQPGSIGAGTTPGRVFPGKKMAGRMGFQKVTLKNLQIIDINIEENIMIIKGSVPGKAGNIIYINNT